MISRFLGKMRMKISARWWFVRTKGVTVWERDTVHAEHNVFRFRERNVLHIISGSGLPKKASVRKMRERKESDSTLWVGGWRRPVGRENK